MFINKDNSIVMNGQVIAESNKREKYCDFIIKNCRQMLHDGSLRPSVRRAIPLHPKGGNVYYFEDYIYFINDSNNTDISVKPPKMDFPNKGIFETSYFEACPSHDGDWIPMKEDPNNTIHYSNTRTIRIKINKPVIIVISKRYEKLNGMTPCIMNIECFYRYNYFMHVNSNNINLSSKQDYYRIVNNKVVANAPNNLNFNLSLYIKGMEKLHRNNGIYIILYKYSSNYLTEKSVFYKNYLKYYHEDDFIIDKYGRVCDKRTRYPIKIKYFKKIGNSASIIINRNYYYRYIIYNKGCRIYKSNFIKLPKTCYTLINNYLYN